jgi:uncharacterized protein (TIGR03089 family)
MMRQPTLTGMAPDSTTTFPTLLATALRGSPGRPLITFYDLESGERTELSVTSYANWVAKTAALLVDECDLTRGDRLLLDLPTHWLGPVFLGAAWAAGMEVVWAGQAALAVCGPAGLQTRSATGPPLLATALLPLGGRFPDPLPGGVRDYGVEVWSQPDGWEAWDPPQPGDAAVMGQTQGDLWCAARAGRLMEDGGRLLTTLNPSSAEGLTAFTEPFARDGSVVLVALPEVDRSDAGELEAALAATYAAERATARALA